MATDFLLLNILLTTNLFILSYLPYAWYVCIESNEVRITVEIAIDTKLEIRRLSTV